MSQHYFSDIGNYGFSHNCASKALLLHLLRLGWGSKINLQNFVYFYLFQIGYIEMYQFRSGVAPKGHNIIDRSISVMLHIIIMKERN